MKHTIPVTFLLILLFLVSHVVGLMIVQKYVGVSEEIVDGEVVRSFSYEELPYGIERPEIEEDISFIPMLLFIVFATVVVLVLMHFKMQKLWKVWFFVSVWFCLLIAFYAWFIAEVSLVLGFILAWLKVVKRNAFMHNLSEVLLYGGLAAIFVPFLNIFSVVVLLVIISVYDMIAVWKTKHMVKMAKFQAKMKTFAGLMIPYGKGKFAILGGGDIGFPLFLSGVVLKSFGFYQALIVSLFFGLGLLGLLLFSKKNKFYPAMPFLTAGGLVGLIVVFFL